MLHTDSQTYRQTRIHSYNLLHYAVEYVNDADDDAVAAVNVNVVVDICSHFQ